MYLPPEQNNNSKHCIIFLSCYSPELGPAPAAHKCTDDVPASSSFPTASAGRCAASDVSANTGDQCTGHRCSDGGSPGDLGHHDRVSVQHICSSTPDSRTLNQSCHCKNAAPRIISVHSFCTVYISCGFYTCFGFLRRSMLLHWALSLSFSVPSPPLPSSPVQCPTWLVSPAKSSQMPRDR